MTSFDRIAAGYIESAGNTVSGLILDEIGEDGHAVANKLWKIAAYLRRRNDGEGGVSEPRGDSPDSPAPGKPGLPGGDPKPIAPGLASYDTGIDWPVIRIPDESIRASMSERFPAAGEKEALGAL